MHFFQYIDFLTIRRPVAMTYFSIAATVAILGAFILLRKMKKRRGKGKDV